MTVTCGSETITDYRVVSGGYQLYTQYRDRWSSYQINAYVVTDGGLDRSARISIPVEFEGYNKRHVVFDAVGGYFKPGAGNQYASLSVGVNENGEMLYNPDCPQKQNGENWYRFCGYTDVENSDTPNQTSTTFALAEGATKTLYAVWVDNTNLGSTVCMRVQDHSITNNSITLRIWKQEKPVWELIAVKMDNPNIGLIPTGDLSTNTNWVAATAVENEPESLA